MKSQSSEYILLKKHILGYLYQFSNWGVFIKLSLWAEVNSDNHQLQI